MGKKNAFTLIELLIVMAVIAILIGIILPTVSGFREEALINKAKGELSTLRTALESYYLHNDNSYPATLAPLASANPRIVRDIPDDPFNPTALADYKYNLNGEFFVVYSVGPDRTAADTMTMPADCTPLPLADEGAGGTRRLIWVANCATQTGAI